MAPAGGTEQQHERSRNRITMCCNQSDVVYLRNPMRRTRDIMEASPSSIPAVIPLANDARSSSTGIPRM